ncbi:hypothetical protein C7974DRAFT_405474 [Boeremia exigua]|uniref:uncharacterized protein n=1 Tax=Boeremia exigua TaxID=749465 RepID=UPI001E8CA621|nr:uncharacterized protein C7974DRAFT_405474 [Boeremia exigua]KAH6612385.1 hypothetical protein C7974DRAFT_405474 [Boeremia exigua]
MSAPPTPRSAAPSLDNGSRCAARRSARARSHSSRTPSPSKKPTPQSYRRGNMRYANALVDALGQLPPAIDGEARRVLGLQSWAELAQPDTHAQTPPEMQARLAELAATYCADSLLNARECALEGNWKSSLFTLLRNIDLLALDTLCLHMSERAWSPA